MAIEITNTEHYHSYTAHLLRGCTSIAITYNVNLRVYATQETAHFRVPAENFSNSNTHNRSHDVWKTLQTVHSSFFLLTRDCIQVAQPNDQFSQLDHLLPLLLFALSRDECDPSNRLLSSRVWCNSFPQHIQ
jgi:hypothetical protein